MYLLFENNKYLSVIYWRMQWNTYGGSCYLNEWENALFPFSFPLAIFPISFRFTNESPAELSTSMRLLQLLLDKNCSKVNNN